MGIGKYISQDFNINHSYLTLKYHHFHGLIRLWEMVIDNCYCAFDLGCEVLDQK